jgi:hypothetical protein
MEEQAIELPPLPKRFAVLPKLILPELHGMGGNTTVFKDEDAYTADQMQAYARACVLAERERCAKVCEALIDGRSKDDLITEEPNDAVTWGEIFSAEQIAAAIRKG